jgi:hypothetical protein
MSRSWGKINERIIAKIIARKLYPTLEIKLSIVLVISGFKIIKTPIVIHIALLSRVK